MKRTFKNNIVIKVLAAVQLMTIFAGQVQAAEGQMTHYHVRQDIVRNEGILVSRPNIMDENMFDFIRLNRIKTLEDYSQWVSDNLVYQQDGSFDNWSLPQETLNKKTGDCEDFALLTKAVTRVLGYKPQFLALIRKEKAHAICVMKQDGYYVWFDNTKFVRTKARTFAEFAKYITTDFQYQEVNELNEETGEWIPRYQKFAKKS